MRRFGLDRNRPAPLPRNVRLLVAARAVNALGAFSLSFLTVLLTKRFGAAISTAGLVCGAFGMATIPSRLIGGRLAQRLGPRRTIVLGLTGCAVAQVGIAASPTLAVAAFFAILLGFVYELYEAPSQAVIADVAGTDDRVRAFSLFNAMLAVGGVGSGLIAAAFGRQDLRVLFVIDALSCLACAIVIRAVLPADQGGSGRKDAQPTSGASPWRDRRLLALLASGTVFAVVYLQVMISLPLSLLKRGILPSNAGLLFTVAALTAIAGQPLLRLRRVSAVTNQTALAAGYALIALGLTGYGVAHTLPEFLLPTLVVSIGNLLLFGRMYATAADLAPTGGESRYLAVFGICWGIAGVAAPVVGSQILQHGGVSMLWFVLAACCAAFAVGSLRSPRSGFAEDEPGLAAEPASVMAET